MQALPKDRKEVLKMPRQYIANVVYTCIGDDFQAWVGVGIEARNQKVKDDRDMDIKMDPEIFAIF